MQIDEALLIRYLAHETDEAENALVARWRQDLPANEQTLQDFERLWAKTEVLKPVFPAFDTDKAWEKFALKIQENEETDTKKGQIRALPTPKRRLSVVWSVAASVFILAAVGLFFWRGAGEERTYAQLTKTRSETSQLTLDDKSVIRLGHQAKISYPEKFGSKQRAIRFEGQASFEIARDASRPFVIETSEKATIKVLGTSFLLTSYAATETAEIRVTSGKVQMSAGGQAIVLQAGEAGIWAGKAQTLTKLTTQQLETKEKTRLHSFDFQNQPLRTVIDQLNRAGARLELDANIENCPITVQFDGQNMETILQIILETLDLTKTLEENGTIMLHGKGC